MCETTIDLFGISRLRMGTDGPGIRTLIGTYGCPMKCKYCINRGSWDGSVKKRNYSLSELYEKIKVDNLYFKASDGGITFGGGEPLVHAKEIKEFVNTYCGEWSIALETSLNVDSKNLNILVDSIDTFYIDIKSMNHEIYKNYTGKDNSLVEENLEVLLNCREKVYIKVPLIPNFNNEEDVIRSISILETMGFGHIYRVKYKVI